MCETIRCYNYEDEYVEVAIPEEAGIIIVENYCGDEVITFYGSEPEFGFGGVQLGRVDPHGVGRRRDILDAIYAIPLYSSIFDKWNSIEPNGGGIFGDCYRRRRRVCNGKNAINIDDVMYYHEEDED